jgi:hypothetical protein
MKVFLSILASFFLFFALTACSSDSGNASSSVKSSTSTRNNTAEEAKLRTYMLGKIGDRCAESVSNVVRSNGVPGCLGSIVPCAASIRARAVVGGVLACNGCVQTVYKLVKGCLLDQTTEPDVIPLCEDVKLEPGQMCEV